MFKSALFRKVLLLIGSMLLLLIPLSMLSSLIHERIEWRDGVLQTLRQSTSGSQRITGPIIVIPWTENRKVKDGEKETSVQVKHQYYYLPETLKIGAQQQVESRNIGIYQGQVWRSGINVDASFDGDNVSELLNKPGITLGKPWLSVILSDSRGITHVMPLQIAEQQFDFQPGSRFGNDNGEGVHVPLPQDLLQKKKLTLSFSMKLMGTQKLEVVPLGKNSAFDLKSDWPHPGFTGSFLPEKRQITAQGFNASWQSSWFANNLNSLFVEDGNVCINALPAFSAAIINPVDQYQQTERAVKYGVLLIGLTYMAFFLYETLTALRVHPMQYLLVGASLVMFFLVLLALSEHIGFNLAWMSASLVCAAMNGIYLQAVLQGWWRSLCFVGGLLILDTILWQLLQSEDSALLLGTGVLVIVLIAVMVLTRNIDWYAMTEQMTREKGTAKEKTGEKERQKECQEEGDDPDRFRLWK